MTSPGSPTCAQARILCRDTAAVDLPAVAVGALPQIRLAELLDAPGQQIGLWEIGPGTATDVEVDEVFIVLAGEGELSFADGSTLTLTPGLLVQLHQGDRTTWEIRSTLRKLYITTAPVA